MLQMVKWSSFLVSEWLDLLVSSNNVTIVLELYRRKWQGGYIYRSNNFSVQAFEKHNFKSFFFKCKAHNKNSILTNDITDFSVFSCFGNRWILWCVFGNLFHLVGRLPKQPEWDSWCHSSRKNVWVGNCCGVSMTEGVHFEPPCHCINICRAKAFFN